MISSNQNRSQVTKAKYEEKNKPKDYPSQNSNPLKEAKGEEVLEQGLPTVGLDNENFNSSPHSCLIREKPLFWKDRQASPRRGAL